MGAVSTNLGEYKSETVIVTQNVVKLGSVPLKQHNFLSAIIFKCHCIKVRGDICLPGGINFWLHLRKLAMALGIFDILTTSGVFNSLPNFPSPRKGNYNYFSC